MHHPAEHSPLGKSSQYVSTYAPELLFPISRTTKWAELGLTAQTLPYQGVDIWNCYELSWLTASGKPVVAIGEFAIPAQSPNIIESKSFKLYLNSLNQTAFDSAEAVRAVMERDLSAAAGAPVGVRVRSLDEVAGEGVATLEGTCIDDLDLAVDSYDHPRPELLRCDDTRRVDEVLYSHLLKSNCPVTGQPDWATVVLRYRGPRIDRVELLRYLVSFRDHAEFHEQCVERIFHDVLAHCRPASLSVEARYTRRGGLDINPWRATGDMNVPLMKRDIRQ